MGIGLFAVANDAAEDALTQEGNLTRAAERLHLSQSTVSNALARLRQQLGEELFQRTARGMTPTARAQALYVPCLLYTSPS
ncbi:LysR family transcriptional regulator, partial [Pseudomonas peli]|uniref:LysR family transcriptional regulator n=1 Tax=Pseudomonas peli TaxID=592361 RepID=UPI003D323EC9